MSGKVMVCLALACLLAGMLATGVQAYELRLYGFPGISQVDCSRTCGAAACQMCTKWIPGNTCPNDQWTVYNYCHANNRESWSVDPQGLTYGLWNYTPNGYYYSHWHYTSKTGAIRGVCLTMDSYDEGVPVVIKNSSHWVVMRGYHGNMSVIGNYYKNQTVVTGVRINDPEYGCCSSCYICAWDGYFTADNWATNYFNNCASGSHWGGTRASAERDTVRFACQYNRDSFNYY